MPIIQPAAPYLALLGDIGYAKEGAEGEMFKAFLHHHSPLYTQIFLIKGNHELYGTSLTGAVAWLRHVCEEIPNVVFLDRDYVDVEDVRILGCTLWSRIPTRHRRAAYFSMRDFDKISDLKLDLVDASTACGANSQSSQVALRHEEIITAKVDYGCDCFCKWYYQDVEWLENELQNATLLAKRGDLASVVILTHHAPITLDDAMCEKTRLLGFNAFGCEGTNIYKSQLDEGDSSVVKAWCYGHTHKCFSMKHGETGTLIISNPMGNSEEKVEGSFCPCCVISIPRTNDCVSATKVCECTAVSH